MGARGGASRRPLVPFDVNGVAAVLANDSVDALLKRQRSPAAGALLAHDSGHAGQHRLAAGGAQGRLPSPPLRCWRGRGSRLPGAGWGAWARRTPASAANRAAHGRPSGRRGAGGPRGRHRAECPRRRHERAPSVAANATRDHRALDTERPSRPRLRPAHSSSPGSHRPSRLHARRQCSAPRPPPSGAARGPCCTRSSPRRQHRVGRRRARSSTHPDNFPQGAGSSQGDCCTTGPRTGIPR